MSFGLISIRKPDTNNQDTAPRSSCPLPSTMRRAA